MTADAPTPEQVASAQLERANLLQKKLVDRDLDCCALLRERNEAREEARKLQLIIDALDRSELRIASSGGSWTLKEFVAKLELLARHQKRLTHSSGGWTREHPV